LPQATPHEVPHSWHSALHRSSQPLWQQNGSTAQTHAWQAQPPQPGVDLISQPVHVPQSAGQVEQSSSAAQEPLPHGHGPQSCGQVWQVSPRVGWQAPLPQQGPQSAGQVWHVSPRPVWQAPLPQQGPQSAGQFWHVSPAPQVPLPHVSGQVPQSAGQVVQLSVGPQMWSPQRGGQGPQSCGHVWQVSPIDAMHWPSPQAGQGPQSLGQLRHDSVGPHLASPQTSGHWPQSWGQVAHVSVGPHTVSGHLSGQAPQSCGQFTQFSPAADWHTPLPQVGQAPQSLGQSWQSSLGPQVPSPQTSGHWPQSLGHDTQLSVASQTELPQRGGQGPQSFGHDWQVSPYQGSHDPLPQAGQAPQSCGQLRQLSDASHHPLPQTAAHWVPHWEHSATHRSSHAVLQQYGSCAQTQLSHEHPPQPGVGRGSQPLHSPQSMGHDEQVSSSQGSHWPLPQLGQ
jgi:hypothetical protein